MNQFVCSFIEEEKNHMIMLLTPELDTFKFKYLFIQSFSGMFYLLQHDQLDPLEYSFKTQGPIEIYSNLDKKHSKSDVKISPNMMSNIYAVEMLRDDEVMGWRHPITMFMEKQRVINYFYKKQSQQTIFVLTQLKLNRVETLIIDFQDAFHMERIELRHDLALKTQINPDPESKSLDLICEFLIQEETDENL